MKVMTVLPLPRKAVPRALVLALSSIILSLSLSLSLPLAQACTRLTYLCLLYTSPSPRDSA